MKGFQALIDALKRDESFRALLYDDATGLPLKKGDTIKGNPTIGYGWNVASSPMLDSEATTILTNRIINAQVAASDLIPNWLLLDVVRQNVVSNMTYNMGKTSLSKFVHFLAAVNNRDYETAADEMKNSAWYGQVGKRAQRLEQEMRTGLVA